MATFLTTSKMNPALAARIEASVRGKPYKPGATKRLPPRLVSLARAALVLVVGLAVYTVVSGRRHDRARARTNAYALLDAVGAQSAWLSPEDKGAVTRAESWLMRSAGEYEGDLVTDELRAPGALAAVLARPAIYVRGPLGVVQEPRADRGRRGELGEGRAPPLPDRAAGVARREGHVRQGAPGLRAAARPSRSARANVRRLHEAHRRPALAPAAVVGARAVRAGRRRADAPEARARRAPVARAKQAARAEAPRRRRSTSRATAGGPTELDGERAHAVRIVLVDLASEKILLRTKKLVDPTWISLAEEVDVRERARQLRPRLRRPRGPRQGRHGEEEVETRGQPAARPSSAPTARSTSMLNAIPQ